jgi:hypothetical protein
MTNRRTSSQIADDIRNRLAEAQGDLPPPEGQSQRQPQSQGLRVTKAGELVPPGQDVPTGPDGQPQNFVTVPDATFHHGNST